MKGWVKGKNGKDSKKYNQGKGGKNRERARKHLQTQRLLTSRPHYMQEFKIECL
jgi:hypothetical protein